jgi:CO dehydrogenase/acetyl-CoA synthase alpha subunit
LNVGAGSLCTPDNDEFDDQIASQEGTNPEFELEDIYIPSKDELNTTIADNIANTAAETSEALEEPIMDSAILTTEVALEVIGVIGIAIIAGMAIYHIIEVFDDPDSTALLFDHQIHHYLGYTKTPHRHSMLLGH